MSESFIIDNQSVAPGESEVVRIRVSRLPSGTRINIFAHVFRAINPGPTVLIMAGVHGDEINGIEIVRRLIHGRALHSIEAGTAIVIPLLNVYGFINFSRDVPDGKDVNRSFPGSSRGSLASRVAHTLTHKILPEVDIAIDMHTGGSSKFNYPQIRYSRKDDAALELAYAFGAPFIIRKPYIPKSFRKVANQMGIPVMVYEGGESERLDGFCIETGLSGTLRVLRQLEMLSDAPEPTYPVRSFQKAGWVRATGSGIFIWTKQSGTWVQKGETLGTISSPQGDRVIHVKAKKDGYIIGHNNASVVHSGDALFHVAYEG